MPAEEVFVALGSNVGDSIVIVEGAIKAIAGLPQTRLTARSSLYRSEPLGDIEQDDFINAVVRLETGLDPLALLLELQAIEHAYYRRRDKEQHWGPRTLDLDIILFGNRVQNDSHLTLPHPEFTNRRFVLEPMLEIDGDRFIAGHGSLSYLAEHAAPLDMQRIDDDDH